MIFPLVFASTIVPPAPVLTQTLSIPIVKVLTPKIAPPVPNTVVVEATSSIYCSCVKTLREEIPDLPNLDAIDFPLNTITPKVGDIIKIQYYNATTTKYNYHIAIIREITEDTFNVYQGNIPKCATSTEKISKTDERILGFFSMDRQRLIDQLTPIQKQTLWNESGWSMYDTKGAVLRGKAGEWGLIQILPQTLEWLTSLRQVEKYKLHTLQGEVLLDKLNFEDQIEMFLYGWSKNVKWYGTPTTSF